MKLAFVSCVQLGYDCFESLIKEGYIPNLCVTLVDNKARNKSGRVFFDEICKKNNISLIKVENINSDQVIKKLLFNNIDILFVIGWSQIVTRKIINSVNHGVYGIHPTLLPIGRGRAPIPWAIIKKLKYTGVTLFKIDEGVDSGDIIDQKKITISKEETAFSLYKKVSRQQIKILLKNINSIISGTYKLKKQSKSKVTYWKKRNPKDGIININGSVYTAARKIRALTHPYPGAFIIKDKKVYIVFSAKVRKKNKKNKFIKFRDGFLELLEYKVTKINSYKSII
tara:strand:+ start:2277 stop:3125 length:849 start_codon:yes stop_codon:yes gene_type:complete